ncbi:GDP-fucose protein O-fucosyltransferase 1 isoform X3 [Hydra vulgaris]|uniref:GDP-fucose protein O-fucosyltransferase 1 n=2 Tax=Hydra vulgaris TaxID=6087 RepID=A0ABM4BEE5_HYDVU
MLIFIVILWLDIIACKSIDENGYVVYCPCMGRFGNQAEQFIGALAFAKGINRTLILPPWVTYSSRMIYKSLQINFDRWFKVNPLQSYHRVILMEEFMEKLSPKIWPPDKRKGFCYSFRSNKECAMKEGNPFGPFWDHFNISFVSTIEHKGLLWNTLGDAYTREGWIQRFPSYKFPVLAFQGAPGNFPSLREHQYLQKYLEFSDQLNNQADDYIKNELNGNQYIAIHLRNGQDMLGICDDLDKYQGSIFSSAQCTGYNNEKKLTHEMCNPSKAEIISLVKKCIKATKLNVLYVATDNDNMLNDFKKELIQFKVSVYSRKGFFEEEVDEPLIDIAILSKSNHFIGSCLSTFSAFVRRQRETRGISNTTFFGLNSMNTKHEL